MTSTKGVDKLWKIQVWIRKKYPWHMDVIPGCTCHLYYPTINEDGPGISLRWDSRDRDDGISEIDLKVGVVARARVAVRCAPKNWDSTNFNGEAWITNEDYLKNGEIKWVIAQGSDAVPMDLIIKSRGKRWPSGTIFSLSVPPEGDSNYGFILSKT